jgi:hypothetical protein
MPDINEDEVHNVLSERGQRTGERVWATESEACQHATRERCFAGRRRSPTIGTGAPSPKPWGAMAAGSGAATSALANIRCGRRRTIGRTPNPYGSEPDPSYGAA